MDDLENLAKNTRPKRPKTPGSGRKLGTPNRKSLDRQALVAATVSADEEAFLRAVMVSPSPLVSLRDRIDCAKALLTAKRFAKEEKPDPKLVEANPKPQWELDAERYAERREHLLAQQRLGKIHPGGALERELEALLEHERKRESFGL